MLRENIMRSTHVAGRVLRYHTWPTISQETIAEHSWGVAMIWLQLFRKCTSSSMVAVILQWILRHDAPELWSGDLPFPVKQRHPPLKTALEPVEAEGMDALGLAQQPEMTDKERDCVKIADLLQMMVFGLHELRLGNKYAQCIADDTAAMALKLAERAGVYPDVKAFITLQGKEGEA
jgi:5'-deoxynucleotidase YfbR-like HD superfamily hydrolase